MTSVPGPPDSLPPDLAELLHELPPELTPEEKREVLRELFSAPPELGPPGKSEGGWSGDGLYLPSFGIRIQRNDPHKIVHHQDDFHAGDAVSRITLPPRALVDHSKLRTWRDFSPDLIGNMRGLLLAILSIEEYTDTYIRLADLRLASAIKPELLKRSLKPVLERLGRPITAKRVADWKLHLLGEELEGVDKTVRAKRKPIWAQTKLLKESFGDEDTGIVAVSFASAALWLFLDLNTPNLRDATAHRLAELIEALAEIVRTEMERLHRSAKKLEKLVTNRPVRRPPDPAFKDYDALKMYRMGVPLEDIATWLEITPWDGEKGEGSKTWRSGVRYHLIEGERFEAEHHPRAAAIFAKKDDPQVRRIACFAYQKYGHKGFVNPHALCAMIQAESPSAEVDWEVAEAYLLLGEAIEWGTTELPK